MNIFAIEKTSSGGIDWVASAKSQDNLRVVKMCLETAQILSTVLYKQGQQAPYKPTHVNHPCVLWAEDSAMNFINLWTHGMALCDEYKERFGKTHKCHGVYLKIKALYKRELFNNVHSTDLPLTMPDEFQTTDVVESYRKYYASKEKIRYPKNKVPNWFKIMRGNLTYQTI
jgi:hypothetical protein